MYIYNIPNRLYYIVMWPKYTVRPNACCINYVYGIKIFSFSQKIETLNL